MAGDPWFTGRRSRKISWGDLMRVLTAVIAIAAGVLVLGGYFFPPLANIQTLLLNWAILFAGMAALVGIFNLISVHTDKVRRQEKGSIYSAVLVIALVVTFTAGLVLRPDNAAMQILMNGIIIPVEAALMGLLTVSLIYAAIRLLRRRADLMSVVFLVTALLLILASATLPFGNIPVLGNLVRPWITQILALGGARGILIGVALGTLTTGLRVLFGADRPYGGN